MPVTLAVAESAWMSSNTRWEQYLQKFNAVWFSDLELSQVAVVWAQLTPEQHDKLRELAPEQYAYYERLLGGKQHASTRTAPDTGELPETSSIPGEESANGIRPTPTLPYR